MSDDKADLSPKDPSEEAIMALAISQANKLVRNRLAKCRADPDTAFTYKWLSENSEVLWLCCRLNVDFDVHMDKLFSPISVIPTLVIDPNSIIKWQMKNAQHWIQIDDQYLCHQALLLGCIWNCSKIEPPGEPEMISLCMVVWVHHDQATITVPEALEHLSTVLPQDEENLNLCKIPADPPFSQSLPPEDESYFITLLGDGTLNLFGRKPQALQIFWGITYHHTLSFWSFMVLNKEISGKANIQPNEVTFYYIKPWEALWINDLYSTVGDDDQSIQAVNPLYLVGPHSILPNPLVELNPTIASVVMTTFEEDPATMANTIKVAECIMMVGKKQFNMMSSRDQESDSVSSLTATITHVKLKPLDKSTICEDDSRLPDDPEDIADTVTPTGGTATKEAANTINDGSASAPATVTKPNTQATPPRGPDVVVNPDHMNYLLTLLCVLIYHSSILDDAYSSIMETFFLHIRIRHAESLGDLNACQAAVNKAVQLWTGTVSQLTRSLGSFPGVSSYNHSVDNLWLCLQALWHEINLTEKQYLDKRKAQAENAAETKATWKKRVWEQVSQAIHQYIQAASRAILIGPNGDHAPWLAQITTWACDFQSRIMSAVADYSDIPMDLWCMAVLQQFVTYYYF